MPENIFRIIFLSLFIIALPLIFVLAGYLGDEPEGSVGDALEIPNPLGTTDFNEIVIRIINWITLIGGSIAVIMIVYSGLLFMTAAGNEEKITKARKALTWSLVGLAVILIGQGWVLIIKEIVGVSG